MCSRPSPTMTPYSWGLIPSHPPEHLPSIITTSKSLTSIYRSLLNVVYLMAAMRTTCALSSTLFLLFSSGTNTEPWMYPDPFGSFNPLLMRGLVGVWSGLWHDLFRYGLLSTSRWFTRSMGLRRKSRTRAAVHKLVSFVWPQRCGARGG